MSHAATAWAQHATVGSSSRKLILLLLADRHNADTGQCDPKIARLAAESELSPRMVSEHLKALEEGGFIRRLPRTRTNGSSTSNQYELLIPCGPSQGGDEVGRTPPMKPVASPELELELEVEPKPSPATPSKVERDSVWDALEAVFGVSTTPRHRRRLGAVQKELLADTSLTPAAVVAEIPRRVAAYRSKWPGMDLTLEAFAKHWPDLRGNNSRPSANFPAAILSPELFREWRRTATRDDMVRYQHEFDVDDHGAPLEGF